jgi:hypothetical protein
MGHPNAIAAVARTIDYRASTWPFMDRAGTAATGVPPRQEIEFGDGSRIWLLRVTRDGDVDFFQRELGDPAGGVQVAPAPGARARRRPAAHGQVQRAPAGAQRAAPALRRPRAAARSGRRGGSACMKFRVHLRSAPGMWATYEGYVDVEMPLATGAEDCTEGENYECNACRLDWSGRTDDSSCPYCHSAETSELFGDDLSHALMRRGVRELARTSFPDRASLDSWRLIGTELMP